MEQYNLEVLDHGVRILEARGKSMADSRAIWNWIGGVARRIDKPGLLIRVTNSAGKIVILVGVATAIRLWAEMSSPLPPL